MDEDWHAVCQAIYKCLEGAELDTMYRKYVELHKAVRCKKSGDNEKAKALWSIKEAKQRNKFPRLGQRTEDPNEIPSNVGHLGNPSEEPFNHAGKSFGVNRECTIRGE